VMLGGDLVLPGSLVRDPRLDYVALGHIHKPQDLNEGQHPPVIYPGSIERVDFSEAREDRFFVITHVERGHTQVEWRKLEGVRPFIDRYVHIQNPENVTQQLLDALPGPDAMQGAIVRLSVEYPRDWEALFDEAVLREHAALAFEFHLVKRPKVEARIRLPQDQGISSLSALDLLEKYWLASHTDSQDVQALQKLARGIIQGKDAHES
jgi:exonuclease SbcD